MSRRRRNRGKMTSKEGKGRFFLLITWKEEKGKKGRRLNPRIRWGKGKRRFLIGRASRLRTCRTKDGRRRMEKEGKRPALLL